MSTVGNKCWAATLIFYGVGRLEASFDAGFSLIVG